VNFFAFSSLYLNKRSFSEEEIRRTSAMATQENVVHYFVGRSTSIERVLQLIAAFARSRQTVLVTGESGTGKELTVKAIHANSKRSGRPMVTVNCAAIPRDLLESELFGHEKGSFTGAFTQKRGKFELADGGTLFLDEIGDTPLELQPKLLRAIGEGDIQRVGRERDIHVDVRVIAATNRDLPAMVLAGTFREDLYYRLSGALISLPPLRDRLEDIPELVRHFIEAAVMDNERIPARTGVTGISPEAESILCNYPWPGNVRQLEHVIAAAVALASNDTIQPTDLRMDSSGPRQVPPSLTLPDAKRERDSAKPQEMPRPYSETMHEMVLRTKREYVVKAHEYVHGNPEELARMIPLHRAGLPRFLDKLGLSHLKPPRGRHGSNSRPDHHDHQEEIQK
jgi:transcriptional regulator with GAF, ATPase, and Fis domain